MQAAVEKGFAREIGMMYSTYRAWVRLVTKLGGIFSFLNPSKESHLISPKRDNIIDQWY